MARGGVPYLGGHLAMTVIVPDDLAAFEATLDADAFAAMVDALSPADVLLSIPRFSTESRLALSDALSELGMPLAFDPDDRRDRVPGSHHRSLGRVGAARPASTG